MAKMVPYFTINTWRVVCPFVSSLFLQVQGKRNDREKEKESNETSAVLNSLMPGKKKIRNERQKKEREKNLEAIFRDFRLKMCLVPFVYKCRVRWYTRISGLSE